MSMLKISILKSHLMLVVQTLLNVSHSYNLSTIEGSRSHIKIKTYPTIDETNILQSPYP